MESERPSIVLVVDDNASNRALAQSTLEGEGYEVVVAGTGGEGVAAFERSRPDCVLLDVRMPDIDGFAVCEHIRALPGGADVPLVFFTASRDVDTFERALRAGADDFLTKPLRPAELLVRVQTALKLRRARGELHEHYEVLKRQRNDLLRLQLQKERLTAFLVHDLKNPVNAMDLHAQLLLRAHDLPENLSPSVLQIRTQAQRLHRMILNLLDLSKSDEGKLSPRLVYIDLHAMVQEILCELDAMARPADVTLQARMDASWLRADADLVQRMLINLLENAIHHAPPRSRVTLSSRADSEGVELRVADSGPGIPPEMRERVFDAFTQIDGRGRGRAAGARGLGLAFCKAAAIAHDGSIWVEEGMPGAVFCVRFPRR